MKKLIVVMLLVLASCASNEGKPTNENPDCVHCFVERPFK